MRSVLGRVGSWGAVLAVAVSTAMVGLPAHAANNGSWSVEPTSPKGVIARQYLVYDVPAGETVKDSVTVTNLLNIPQSFKIFGADGYTTEHDGGLGLKKVDEPQDAVGSWITTSRNELTLGPREVAKIPFTIKVPTGTAPGDHAGAVVALNTLVQPGTGAGPNIGIQRAVATRVYLRVQGSITPGLQVKQVWLERTGSAATVHYVLANTGNVRLEPTGLVSLTGVFGRSLENLPPLDLGTLLPGETSEYAQVTGDLPVVDNVTATVSATAPEATASASDSVLVLPWWIIAVVVALVILIGLLIWYRRRRRTSAPPARAPREREVVSA